MRSGLPSSLFLFLIEIDSLDAADARLRSASAGAAAAACTLTMAFDGRNGGIGHEEDVCFRHYEIPGCREGEDERRPDGPSQAPDIVVARNVDW